MPPRHDNVAKIVHQELALGLQSLQKEKATYYNYSAEPILENDNFRLYWDGTVLTHQTVGIILVDKAKRSTRLIKVSIPIDSSLIKRLAKKIFKYQDLAEKH